MRFRGRIGSAQGAGRWYRRRARRLRSGDAPPVRWERFQFGLFSEIVVPPAQAGPQDPYDPLNTTALTIALLTELNFTVGGSQDLGTMIRNVELGGIVWSSRYSCITPITNIRRYDPIHERLFLQRNDGSGAPVSLPSPWVSTPPFGGVFTDEQEHLPVRDLSRRERLIGIGDLNTDGEGTLAEFPSKSLRIRRRFGDYTGFYIQTTVGHTTSIAGTTIQWYLNGTVFYRTRF